MTIIYCDCCGKEFDKWHQTVKHEIRTKDKEKGWRDLDICDECRKDIESFIDQQFGVEIKIARCTTCKFYERDLSELPCCECNINNSQWEGKTDDNR